MSWKVGKLLKIPQVLEDRIEYMTLSHTKQIQFPIEGMCKLEEVSNVRRR